ncbi:sulfite exporter TauE/SafE family protein [Longispora sp. NPDC051575]|uniref:sulfite exporter TauE/SafE family protein n=1 Tax=Longispora sp. NPDC051575 TaxID=3154943 RepID=UPI00341BD14D
MPHLLPVLLTGLFVGGVSCTAGQGGLLAGLVLRQRQAAAPLPAGRPFRTRLGDDLVPVGGFLLGKLASHTVLGALLGALGGAVQLSVGTRAGTQLLAGLLIVLFGLAQLGVPGFRRIRVEPPAAWSRLARGRARSTTVFAPGLLGVASVLIPCGVTLSVEALALASGTWWAGAATMAVFVAGTGPLFAVLGYAARRAATAWRGRFALATGVLVVAVGAVTFNGGLELAGSPVAASALARGAGLSDGSASAATVTTDAAGAQEAVLTVLTGGYSPADLAVRPGVPTTLVVRAVRATGCVRAFVLGDREYALPENGDTRIRLGVLRPGTVRFRCGMGMYTGRLTVGEPP